MNGAARPLGWLVAAAGALTLVSTLRPPWRPGGWVAELLFGDGVHLARGTAVLVGTVLMIIGRGVARRHRAALYATTVLLLIATVLHVISGLDLVAAAVTATVAVTLMWHRNLFVVAMRPARLLDVAGPAALLLTVDFGYGLLGLYLQRALVTPPLTVRSAVTEVATRLIGVEGPLAVTGEFGRWFPASLNGLGVLTAAWLLLAVLSPIASAGSPAEADRERVRTMLERADTDTLAPFVLRRDKHLVFAPGADAALGFRYVRGVGLASGDPVGDPAAFPGALDEFLSLCERHGWRPAVVGVRSDHVPMYEALGWNTLYVGDEAVIDVNHFTLTGRRMRNARQAVSRSRNAGMTTALLREGDVDEALRAELLAVTSASRAGQPEFGFSMALGDLFSGEYPDCLVAVCRDRFGHAVAFQRYLPCGEVALSLDAMYRRPDAPNGATERLIADVVEWARSEHVVVLSLNFAAFRAVLDPAEKQPGLRVVITRLLQHLDGALGLQIDTLRVFNAKFAPRWVPRYLAYRSTGDLPAVGLAALAAEGFLPLDPARLAPADAAPTPDSR
ncbi:bifunctional lysylphosphatidylglycerol flippase/synthetase MprF [Lentzea sp. HUAS12]|uniref:bifunctional lysylphosphatidylglycerol flippase/synthetase MprF n=1 Tax=Lentzea sp. HUAS12 TaxID=2951806 RepID=UPI0020A02346|nr:phosphatidylglycerol lysyltransferase domain-containing protein [Lentzea sp. HUAS12]USX53970.1 phosphatidylglycerol lysyltransferase domain-containing protein [Lentzea sp. HUAS12]